MVNQNTPTEKKLIYANEFGATLERMSQCCVGDDPLHAVERSAYQHVSRRLQETSAVNIDSLRAESEWELNPGRFSCEHFRCKKCHFISCLAVKYCGECGSRMKNAGVKPEELPLPAEEKTYESRKSDIFEEVEF